MIAVSGSEGRRNEGGGARNEGSPRPSVPVGQGNHEVHRGAAIGTLAPVETRPKLSGEVGGRPPLMEKQPLRRDGRAERNERIVRGHASQQRPNLRECGVRPSAPPVRDSRLGRGAPSSWHQQPERAVQDSSRHYGSSSWTTYNGRQPPLPRDQLFAASAHDVRAWHWNRSPQASGWERRNGPAVDPRRPAWSWPPALPRPPPAVVPSPPPPVSASAGRGNDRDTSKHRVESQAPLPSNKRPKSDLDKLDLLCQATLEIGPMHENPTGCTCPKSKCIALYCDCFKAGRRCNPKSCGCLNCKNTVAESGPDGARTKAIRSILARNPRAFVTAGVGNATRTAAPGEAFCNCIRSRCLKLYCTCFQSGRVCAESCTCIGCYNTDSDTSGERQLAIQLCLEKRPDAFETRVREPGLGCACKNNRCVRKYCECFRTGLACSKRCSCRQCENRTTDNEAEEEEKKYSPEVKGRG